MSIRTFFSSLAVAAACAAGVSAHAALLTDPGFDVDPSNGTGNADNTEVGAWYANNIFAADPNHPDAGSAGRLWHRAVDMVGPSGVVENVAAYNTQNTGTADTRGLIQVATGASGSTGVQTLSFDFLLNDVGADSDLSLRAEVFGINTAAWTGAFDLAVPNTSGDVAPQDSYEPLEVTELLNTTAFTATTDAAVSGGTWQSAAFDVDLGAGYEQVAVRFTASDRGASGDQIAVDNVSLAAVPEPAATALALAGLGLATAIRRRK